MKKILAFLLMVAITGWTAQAQLSEAGLPLSMQSALKEQYVPVSNYSLPDWNSAIAKNELAEATGKPQPYLLALFTASDVSFPASGVFTTANNGHQVWRTQVKVDGAKALGFYYDKFKLPKGVNMYVTNANGYQILGAYTSNNNAPSKTFANEAVQGSVVTIEMNIAPGVNLNDIEMHIDRTAVYFRGIEYLAQFTIDPSKLHEVDHRDTLYTGRSSVCMINAICPEGVNYPNQRKATFQTLLPVTQGVAGCSATMLNNTGNTTSNCKQYFLAASHCDGANSSSSAHFDQLILRFNFEQSVCNATTTIPQSNTMTGANFIARSNYDENAPIDSIKGDFLLMEARQAIPASWNVVLAGWNKDPNIATTTVAPKKFIGFHHPNLDVKKVSSAQEVFPAVFNSNVTDATHWLTTFTEGLLSPGSSGSGLFDGDGYLIGVASVAQADSLDPSCELNAAGHVVPGTANVAIYSQFAYDWDYNIDGPANNRKLKPWLDPVNSGVVKLNPVKSNCTLIDDGTGISINNNALDNAISIYPNPSTTGMVTAKVNFKESTDLTVEVYNIAGARQNVFTIPHTLNGSFTFNLSQYANGMYLLKFSNGSSVTTKKIMLSK